ncbi:hypothetical protein [Desulfovirgula thermocuniculi]|uniref:hypothetical protein n=1 Tax=Desulfovirgula thermocuniculi TaxID=348842 RepID=UPI00040F082A|nr:hypothetical protein [Desulfovirgula thermocuniculi]
MEKKSFDASLLPDLLKSLLHNLDPSVLEQLERLRESADPQALSQQFDQVLRLLHQNFGGDEGQALAQLWHGIMEMMKQQK